MILTFKNTRAVIVAERGLRQAEIKYEVIPTPRHISSECGMCLKIKKEDLEKIRNLKIDYIQTYEDQNEF